MIWLIVYSVMDTLYIKNSKIELSNDEIDSIKIIIPKTFELVRDFKSDKVREQTLLSKYMIVTNLNCKEDDIYYNALKKPYVKNKLYFNISHSKEYIVFVNSTNEIGIDIEHIGKKNLNILEHAFTKSEIGFIKNDGSIMNDKESRLILLWTIKESLFKASGANKYIDPKNVEVDLNEVCKKDIDGKEIIETFVSFMGKNYYVYSFKYIDYIISVASTDTYKDIELVHQAIT